MMASRSDDRGATAADEAAQLLSEMRALVESATRELDGLTSELTESRVAVDQLETLVDLLLSTTTTPIVVIDDGRRITGLSRAADERLDGASIGTPLSSLLPADVVHQVNAGLDSARAGAFDLPAAGAGARALPLPGGGAVMVLPGS